MFSWESRPGSLDPALFYLLRLMERQTDGSRKSCPGIAVTEEKKKGVGTTS